MIPTPTPESESESSFDSNSGVGIAPGLEVTVAMCLFQLRSDVIVIPRYLADLTFSRASLWSLYGNLIGHFLRVTVTDTTVMCLIAVQCGIIV